jgi:hypothetical protein
LLLFDASKSTYIRQFRWIKAERQNVAHRVQAERLQASDRSAEQLREVGKRTYLFDLGERSENDQQQRREDDEALAQLVGARSHL